MKKLPIVAAQLADYIGGDVTFTYLDHRNKSYKDLTLSQTEMMLRILNHVSEKHFKMIRYFGFAAMMKAFLKVDPFKCILCGARMVFTGFIAGLKVGQLVSAIENIALQRPI
ncbi:hypothetical protein AYY26_20265 [Photobacterium phosphoreum]|nr:hypothetical protein AYY26_20265 [Photobacterium phosphoreum]